jgi:long-chain acyl-CoA synthetase
VPTSIDYQCITLYEAVAATAQRLPEAIAWDFFDTTATYRELLASIDARANALAALGLRAGDRLLISMPTAPAGVIAVYAANKIGVVSALIHPLSTEPEIEQYLNDSGARVALTLDAFYGVFARVQPRQPLRHIVLARIGDYLSPVKRFGFWLTKGRKIAPVPADARVALWKDLMAGPHPPAPRAATTTEDPAAILFSGGTTGVPKGVVLSNRNLIAEGMQAAAWGSMRAG